MEPRPRREPMLFRDLMTMVLFGGVWLCMASAPGAPLR